jgi:hypothetical protein
MSLIPKTINGYPTLTILYVQSKWKITPEGIRDNKSKEVNPT